jgi:hypothetical protein
MLIAERDIVSPARTGFARADDRHAITSAMQRRCCPAAITLFYPRRATDAEEGG